MNSPAWPKAPLLDLDPIEESLRLDELRSLNLLDSNPETRFDRITRLAADFFRVPMAYVAFIEHEHQWFKSRVGDVPDEAPRALSFCQYTIQRNETLVIEDTLTHPIGKDHPLVVGEPHVRFYAGVPLSGPRGTKIGSFCLVDTTAREFGEKDVAALVAFACLVEREISLSQIIQSQNELLETRQQLVDTQRELEREFSDAAKYVRMILPAPFSGVESLDWQFHPSRSLGGDGLGYRLNDDQTCFYILDVTGHGLGSALLAVTALELLRNRNPASGIDFTKPAKVIERLNRTFQMKDHAGKFFSVWYGVYSRSAQTLTYSNAGHPPALLLAEKDGKPRLQKTEPGTSVLGIMPAIEIPELTIPFPAGSEIYLFTDGLYELLDPHGGRGSYTEFFSWLEDRLGAGQPVWNAMLKWLDDARGRKGIDDDVTFLRFATSPKAG